MKQPESNFRNMVISLGGITIVAAVLLSWVNGVTEAPIKEAEFKSQTAAMEKVMPQHDNNPFDDKFTTTINGTEVTIYPAIADGKLAGAAVESSADGFAGKIAVVYGFEADGTVKDYSVLQHSETPGLGSKMQEWFRDPQGKRSIVGRNPGTERLTVSKDGGDVDAAVGAPVPHGGVIGQGLHAEGAQDLPLHRPGVDHLSGLLRGGSGCLLLPHGLLYRLGVVLLDGGRLGGGRGLLRRLDGGGSAPAVVREGDGRIGRDRLAGGPASGDGADEIIARNSNGGDAQEQDYVEALAQYEIAQLL